MHYSHNSNTLNYAYKESITCLVIRRIKIELFKKITFSSLNFFFRPKDIISFGPCVSGSHEPFISDLINHASKSGFNNFLIDIGSNIGLTLCQSHLPFKEKFGFEPNPILFKVLEANVMLENISNLKLFNVGIGTDNNSSELIIPKHNWGGGFILDSGNSYELELIAKKDGFKSFDPNNYLRLPINIRSGAEIFSKIFIGLEKSNLTNGVIKVDTEGYEQTIIKELIKSLPKNFKLFIIFESWGDSGDLIDFLKEQKNQNYKLFYSLKDSYYRDSPLRNILRLLLNLLKGKYSVTTFFSTTPTSQSSDSVLIIEN